MRLTRFFATHVTPIRMVAFHFSIAILISFALFVGAQQKKADPKEAPPQALAAIPLGVELGTTTKVTLRGLRLEPVTEIRFQEPRTTGKLVGKPRKIGLPNNVSVNIHGDSEIDFEVTLPKEVAGDAIPFTLVSPAGESKAHRLIVKDGSTITVEKEPNDGFGQPQPIAIPSVVEGSIRQAQDVDVFRIDGKAGDTLTFELQANRFGSPVDGILTLYDQAGRIIASADDSPGSTDPILKVKLPRDGLYLLSLIDANDQGGSIYVYRLIARRSAP